MSARATLLLGTLLLGGAVLLAGCITSSGSGPSPDFAAGPEVEMLSELPAGLVLAPGESSTQTVSCPGGAAVMGGGFRLEPADAGLVACLVLSLTDSAGGVAALSLTNACSASLTLTNPGTAVVYCAAAE